MNRKIHLNSRRLPDVSADPSSENPPQNKHFQLRHTVTARGGGAHEYKQTSFQSFFTLLESSKSSIQKQMQGKHCESFLTTENTPVAHINP